MQAHRGRLSLLREMRAWCCGSIDSCAIYYVIGTQVDITQLLFSDTIDLMVQQPIYGEVQVLVSRDV